MKHNFLLFGEASTVHVLVDVSSAFLCQILFGRDDT